MGAAFSSVENKRVVVADAADADDTADDDIDPTATNASVVVEKREVMNKIVPVVLMVIYLNIYVC